MWNKAPAMIQAMQSKAMAVPRLRPEEMADIVAYLYSVRYFAQAGDPKAGVQVATQKGCFGCHSLYGERGKIASDLTRGKSLESPAAVLSALWNHAFISEPKPARDKAPWPEFRPEEMADLVAYLQLLRTR
jgi:mono/diheme cytochrome c family protein